MDYPEINLKLRIVSIYINKWPNIKEQQHSWRSCWLGWPTLRDFSSLRLSLTGGSRHAHRLLSRRMCALPLFRILRRGLQITGQFRIQVSFTPIPHFLLTKIHCTGPSSQGRGHTVCSGLLHILPGHGRCKNSLASQFSGQLASQEMISSKEALTIAMFWPLSKPWLRRNPALTTFS